MTDNVPMVTITAARLAELEAAEKRLVLQRSKNTESVKHCINKDRETYNARRREAYRLKKAAAAASATPGVD